MGAVIALEAVGERRGSFAVILKAGMAVLPGLPWVPALPPVKKCYKIGINRETSGGHMRKPNTLRNIILALFGAILVVILAFENRQPVQVHFFFWALSRVSLALLMLVCLLIGALLGAAGVWWDRHRQRKIPHGISEELPSDHEGNDASGSENLSSSPDLKAPETSVLSGSPGEKEHGGPSAP